MDCGSDDDNGGGVGGSDLSSRRDENANQWTVIWSDRTTVMTRESKNFHPKGNCVEPAKLLGG